MNDALVRYVGNPDFHDGSVREVRAEGDKFLVVVEGYSGMRYQVRFANVQSVVKECPEGMILYGLTERPAETTGLFRYTFVNWSEPDENTNGSALEIIAKSFEIEPASR